MKLLTEEQRTKLLANGTRRGAAHKPVVKWFNASGSGTWLVSELDPEYPDECGFGLADLGFGTPELGSIGLLELIEYRGPFGLDRPRASHVASGWRRSGISPRAAFMPFTSAPGARNHRWLERLSWPARPRPPAQGRRCNARPSRADLDPSCVLEPSAGRSEPSMACAAPICAAISTSSCSATAFDTLLGIGTRLRPAEAARAAGHIVESGPELEAAARILAVTPAYRARYSLYRRPSPIHLHRSRARRGAYRRIGTRTRSRCPHPRRHAGVETHRP